MALEVMPYPVWNPNDSKKITKKKTICTSNSPSSLHAPSLSSFGIHLPLLFPPATTAVLCIIPKLHTQLPNNGASGCAES